MGAATRHYRRARVVRPALHARRRDLGGGLFYLRSRKSVLDSQLHRSGPNQSERAPEHDLLRDVAADERALSRLPPMVPRASGARGLFRLLYRSTQSLL